MNFYTRVFAKFSAATGMKLTVRVEIAPEGGISRQKIDETKKALVELGLQKELDPPVHEKYNRHAVPNQTWHSNPHEVSINSNSKESTVTPR